MARYLVIAHQTATSSELVDALRDLGAEQPDAEFALVVPATPVDHMLTWEEGETKAIARRNAEHAREHLQVLGLKVIRAGIGDASPLQAIEDELREAPDRYDAIIISTLPPGISRWLGLDVIRRAERRFSLPIMHVVAASVAATRGASPP